MNDDVNPPVALASPPDEPRRAREDLVAAFAKDPSLLFAWACEAARGRSPSDDALELVRRENGRLVALAPEVLLERFDAALLSTVVMGELDALQRWGVLALLLPEVDPLVGFHRSCSVHHKDLWDHTLQVLARMPPDADLRWAVLMHDAGKIATRAMGPDGRVGFLRHEAVGAFLMRGVAARFAMPAARASRIIFVIEHHGRVNAYDKGWSDRAVARLARDAGPYLGDLLAFSRADFTTKRTAKAGRIQDNLRDLDVRLAAREARQAVEPRFPRGFGVAVAHELGVDPGPAVGEAIAWLEAEIDAGRLPTRDARDVWLEAVRRRGAPQDPQKG